MAQQIFRISGRTTFGEYLECHQILAAKRRWWIRGVLLIYGIGLIIFQISRWPDAGWTWISAVASLAIVYALVISPIQFRFRVKRNWLRYPKMRQDIDISVTKEGINVADDAGNPAFTRWESFIGWKESPSLFLIYLSPLLPLCLPKRLIQDTELPHFRELLAEVFANGDKT